MIKQEKDYIRRQKKKYGIYTLIWTIVVLGFYGIGIIITGERANIFTIIAGFLVIGLALSLSRLCVYFKFKDGNTAYSELLETMKGSLSIFHSCIIPDTRTTSFVEHIVVTSRNIYFLVYDEEVLRKNRLWLENRLRAKGIELKQIHFIRLDHENSVKNAMIKIEKDACYTSEKLEEYTQLIQELIM